MIESIAALSATRLHPRGSALCRARRWGSNHKEYGDPTAWSNSEVRTMRSGVVERRNLPPYLARSVHGGTSIWGIEWFWGYVYADPLDLCHRAAIACVGSRRTALYDAAWRTDMGWSRILSGRTWTRSTRQVSPRRLLLVPERPQTRGCASCSGG